jgi:hypothetical protein
VQAGAVGLPVVAQAVLGIHLTFSVQSTALQFWASSPFAQPFLPQPISPRKETLHTVCVGVVEVVVVWVGVLAEVTGHVQTPVIESHIGAVMHELIRERYDREDVSHPCVFMVLSGIIGVVCGGVTVSGWVVVGVSCVAGESGHVSVVVVLQSAFNRTYFIVLPSGHVPAVFMTAPAAQPGVFCDPVHVSVTISVQLGAQ